jgi:Na+/H+ antiporter NhaD/arsenite permease-like protein
LYAHRFYFCVCGKCRHCADCAPIALELAKKLKINPVNMMIGIAISSNLQGAATLIGDPPSMLLAGFAKMTFFDFVFYHGRPSIFFAVEIGALASFFVLYYFYRFYKQKTELVAIEKVKSWVPTQMLVWLIVALAMSSFLIPVFLLLPELSVWSSALLV